MKSSIHNAFAAFALPDAKAGFVVYAGDIFPETDHYAVPHFKDTGDCLVQKY